MGTVILTDIIGQTFTLDNMTPENWTDVVNFVRDNHQTPFMLQDPTTGNAIQYTIGAIVKAKYEANPDNLPAPIEDTPPAPAPTKPR